MVTALFVRPDSVYKSMGLDCYDIDRDARTYTGKSPVIAHPPCRAWGKLKAFAKPRPGEKELAIYAVETVRKYGGVLEHPYGSTLFKLMFLPLPGYYDYLGGYTIEIDQFNFGHRAQKRTWIYIMGCPVQRLPVIPKVNGNPEFFVRPAHNRKGAKIISKKEREATPLAFATWLHKVASMCNEDFLKQQ